MKELSIIKTESLKKIADKYRELTSTEDSILMSELPDLLDGLHKDDIIEDFDDSIWERPSEYPDLEIFNDEIENSDDIVIMSIDNKNRLAFYSFYIYFWSATANANEVVVDIGVIENDEFNILETITKKAGSNITLYKDLSVYDYDYLVARFKFSSSRALKFMSATHKGITFEVDTQPIVELIVKETNANSSQNFNSYSFKNKNMVHAKLIGLKELTNMSGGFKLCKRLKSIEFIDCDFTKVTDISAIFQGCSVLNHVEGFFDADFSKCVNFRQIFAGNLGFTELDLSMTIGNSPVTSFEIFTDTNCLPRIKKLTLGMDFSNMLSTYANRLKLSSIGFTNLRTLEYLDISKSKFPTVTSMASAFSNMPYLKTIVIKDAVNTKNIETVADCFSGDTSLELIDMKFDFSDKLTNINNIIYKCIRLEEIEISGVSSVPAINFNVCSSLKKVAVHGITSTTTTLTFASCGKYLEYIDFSDSDLTGVSTVWSTILPSIAGGGASIKYININRDCDIAGSIVMTKDDLIKIFNDLPTVENKTMKITGYLMVQLSEDEKSIATNKGWKVVA